MSGIYTVTFDRVGVTVAQDLIALVAHATKQCVLLGFGISQTSDFGDAQEEILPLVIQSGATVVGSGGTAPTPTNNDGSAGASGFTARVNDTTRAGTGTIVTHYQIGWNIRVPYDWVPTEPMQLIFGAGRRLVIALLTNPSDALTVSGYAVVQEIG